MNSIKKTKPTVILGGGPTGLAAAYRLAQANQPFILLEKENYLGGLSATLKKDGFLYEFGPHAFHLKDPQIIDWLKDLLGPDFRVIPTNTHVLIEGQLFSYPLKGAELLRKIRWSLGLKILGEYLLSYLKNIFRRRKPATFEEWGLANFGPTLYEMSFGNFTRKVWGMDPKKISAKLANQKISRLNLGDITLKLLGFHGKNQPAYFHQYLYPKEGIETIFQKMLKKIRQKGQIFLGVKITKLKNIQGRIRTIQYQEAGGRVKEILPSKIISTMTIKDLAGLINHPVQAEVLQASHQLRYRDMIIVYILTKENNPLFSSQWIYLVEDKFKFNRLTISKNLSPKMTPKSLTVLAWEICCQKGDSLWQKKDQELLAMVKEEMKKLQLDPKDISNYFVERIENAYPIYVKNFEKNVQNVFKSLAKISNLISTGRNGLYLNSDIHDCFKMGFEAASATIQSCRTEKWYKKESQKWLNQ